MLVVISAVMITRVVHVCLRSYSNCSLVKYMEKHKVKPDSKAFLLVCTHCASTILCAVLELLQFC